MLLLLFPGRREVLSELEVVSTVEEDEMSDLASLEINNKCSSATNIHC